MEEVDGGFQDIRGEEEDVNEESEDLEEDSTNSTTTTTAKVVVGIFDTLQVFQIFFVLKNPIKRMLITFLHLRQFIVVSGGQ